MTVKELYEEACKIGVENFTLEVYSKEGECRQDLWFGYDTSNRWVSTGPGIGDGYWEEYGYLFPDTIDECIKYGFEPPKSIIND